MSATRHLVLAAAVVAGCGGEFDDNICYQAMEHIAACMPDTPGPETQVLCDSVAAAEASQALAMSCDQIRDGSRQKSDWINGPFKGCDEPCFTKAWGIFCAPTSSDDLSWDELQDCCVKNDQFRWRSPECDSDADSPDDDYNWNDHDGDDDWWWDDDDGDGDNDYGSCSGIDGTCMDVDEGGCDTYFVKGKCPNYGNSIRCCVSEDGDDYWWDDGDGDNDYGSCSGIDGTCMDVNEGGCDTYFVKGECPDYGNNIRCCVE
jgi:hypothetical protein